MSKPATNSANDSSTSSGASATTAKPANKWAERLRGRTRMAVAAIGGVFILGLMCVSRPLCDRIDTATARLKKANERMMLASDVANLRRQASGYEKKLQRGVDLNDWTNYLLGGIRTQKVKLVRMEPKKQMDLGPCKVLTWHIEIMGDFESLARIVEWIENGQRLVRIDKLVIQARGGALTMALVLKGLVINVPEKGLKDGAGPTTRPRLPTSVPVHTVSHVTKKGAAP